MVLRLLTPQKSARKLTLRLRERVNTERSRGVERSIVKTLHQNFEILPLASCLLPFALLHQKHELFQQTLFRKTR